MARTYLKTAEGDKRVTLADMYGELRKEVPAAELSEVFSAVHKYEAKKLNAENIFYFALRELRKKYPKGGAKA